MSAARPWVLTCAGTLGDHLPFFALARALESGGVPCVLAVNPAMLPAARTLGLDAGALGEAFGSPEARDLAWTYDHWRHPGAQAALAPGDRVAIAAECQDLAALCRQRGARGLLAPAQVPHGRIAAELAGVAWHSIVLMPAFLATDAQAPRDAATRALDERFARFFDALRWQLGLSALDTGPRSHLVSHRGLLAASPAFFTPDPDEFPHIEATGFWWADPPGADGWEPSPGLAAFMDRDPPPLVLSFSSLPLESPGAVLARYREAASMLAMPLLVLAGWSGLGAAGTTGTHGDGALLVVDTAPHRWLFPRASAVITHGGIGTVARALQAGRPLLVEPYGNDQIFNALRVVQLRAGAAVHPHRATGPGIARVIEGKVLAPETREAVARVARALAREAGLDAATAWLRQA